MRTKIDAGTFIQALDQVSGLIRKSVIPALNCVLVQFEQDRCTLTATNLETWLAVELPAQGGQFAFLLGRPRETARAFRQFEGELTLEQTETGEGAKRQIRLTLSCGPRSAELDAFLPEDFPLQQDWEVKHSFTANAARLYARVERVKYAAGMPDSDTFRACRKSIQFSGSNVYAVDGYRLACDCDPELTVPMPFMTSPEALGYLKLFGGQEMTVRLGERYGSVTDGVTTITFRLPEGELFKLASAVPSKFQAEFTVCPKDFLAELNYLKRSLRGKTRHAVQFSGGHLSADSCGERYDTMVQTGGDAGIIFSFALNHMMDALKQFEKEPMARMKLTSPSGALIIEADGRKDFAIVALLRIRRSMAA